MERRASVGCVRACVYLTEFADIFLDAGPGSVPDESLLAAAASALLHCARLPGAPASAGKAADTGTGHASCMPDVPRRVCGGRAAGGSGTFQFPFPFSGMQHVSSAQLAMDQ